MHEQELHQLKEEHQSLHGCLDTLSVAVQKTEEN